MANINYDYEKFYSRGTQAYEVEALPLPERLPTVKPATRPRRRQNQQPQEAEKVIVKMGIHINTIILIGLAFLCAFALVYFSAAVQQNNRQIRVVTQQTASVQSEAMGVRSVINETHNLSEVEAAAERLGFARPQAHQQVRVYVSR